MARTPKNTPDPTPPDAQDADAPDGADDQDDEYTGFAQRFIDMEDKVGRIPDDIGEKLDQLLARGEQTHGHAESAGQQGTASVPGASEGQSGFSAAPHTPEKKPESRHWYYGKPFGRKS